MSDDQQTTFFSPEFKQEAASLVLDQGYTIPKASVSLGIGRKSTEKGADRFITNLIGVLVSSATGKPLSDYLSEKVWKPFGMAQDASWLLGSTGHEISGCCLQASTRDFARFGLFILGGGVVDGEPVLPDGWLAQATRTQAETDRPGYGYGYQWWTLDNGAFMARGIFGQGIFIDPERDLVIASNGNWLQASDRQGGTQGEERLAFYRQVQQAIDRESAP